MQYLIAANKVEAKYLNPPSSFLHFPTDCLCPSLSRIGPSRSRIGVSRSRTGPSRSRKSLLGLSLSNLSPDGIGRSRFSFSLRPLLNLCSLGSPSRYLRKSSLSSFSRSFLNESLAGTLVTADVFFCEVFGWPCSFSDWLGLFDCCNGVSVSLSDLSAPSPLSGVSSLGFCTIWAYESLAADVALSSCKTNISLCSQTCVKRP